MTPPQYSSLRQENPGNHPLHPLLPSRHKWYTLPPKDIQIGQGFAEVMASWEVMRRFTESLERNMLIYLPVMRTGITFECAGSSFGQTTPGIIMRTNSPLNAGDFDLGHGYCAACCKFLPATNSCPCQVDHHDHCVSFCLSPAGCPTEDNLRICIECAPIMLGLTIVQLTKAKQGLTALSLAGNCLGQWDRDRVPQQFWQLEHELRTVICEAQEVDAQTVRFATDGYAYTKLQFIDYYTTHADIMWSMAGNRNCTVRVIHDDVILDRHNYASFLRVQDMLPVPSHAPPGFCYLQEVEGMRDYIPPQFWPHEPILDACMHDAPTMIVLPEVPSSTTSVSSGNPIRTHWVQVPRAYKSALAPMSRLPLGMDELANFITAGGLLGPPAFVLAYRTDCGAPVNLRIAAKWPQLQLHRPLRACPSFGANVKARIEFIMDKKGLFRPAIPLLTSLSPIIILMVNMGFRPTAY